ncbi:MAG: CRTAC1 family protein, partial [Flavobacteriales bacterium]|nr:CRTAC1 family protein [Flavobacteriales bacterium]
QDGTFKEEAAQRGLGNITAFVKGVTFGDINNDRWPDLYISVLGGKNRMYKNNEGQFENVSQAAGTESPKYSFPCWFWDVNNDGYQDIFVSGYDTRNLRGVAEDYAKELQGMNVRSSKPRLYINQKDGTFSERTMAYGLNRTMYAMGANFGDLDNDGWLDFYVGTGAPDFSTVVPNRMFRNKGGKVFEEVTSAGRFGHIQKGHGISFADLDRDGDQDIYAVMGGAFEGDVFTNVLFENPISENNWIVMELEGTTTNRDAIGTRMTLKLDDQRELYHVISTGGTFGSNSLQAEIGLGKAETISELKIHWQNSDDQVFKDIEPGKKYKVIEGEAGLIEMDYSPLEFSQDAAVHEHHH